LGTIPYMVVWMLLLYILLALQMNMALALSDHDKQVIAYDCGNPSGIQAYDIGEQNHWCDLNPLLGNTNMDITITNVSYVLLQKARRPETAHI
jgi:predicted permease